MVIRYYYRITSSGALVRSYVRTRHRASDRELANSKPLGAVLYLPRTIRTSLSTVHNTCMCLHTAADAMDGQSTDRRRGA
eukprot:SAG31_NODE_9470_length_1272_cov_1.606138_3_plen_80_part_00